MNKLLAKICLNYIYGTQGKIDFYIHLLYLIEFGIVTPEEINKTIAFLQDTCYNKDVKINKKGEQKHEEDY